MKLIFSATAIIFLSQLSYSQTTKEFKWGLSFAINSSGAQIGKPEESSWGYAKTNFLNYGDITDNSISISIIPKYYIKNDFLFRFEFSLTNIDLKHYYESPTNNTVTTQNIISQSIEQSIYRFIPGIQWIFIKKKMLESFAGFSLSYLQYHDMKYHDLYKTKDLSQDSTVFYADDNANAKGGYAFGGGCFWGFNIYFLKYVSVGAELSVAVLKYELGGEFSGKVEINNMSSPPQFEEYSYSTSSYNGIQFTKIIPSLNIGLSF